MPAKTNFKEERALLLLDCIQEILEADGGYADGDHRQSQTDRVASLTAKERTDVVRRAKQIERLVNAPAGQYLAGKTKHIARAGTKRR